MHPRDEQIIMVAYEGVPACALSLIGSQPANERTLAFGRHVHQRARRSQAEGVVAQLDQERRRVAGVGGDGDGRRVDLLDDTQQACGLQRAGEELSFTHGARSAVSC